MTLPVSSGLHQLLPQDVRTELARAAQMGDERMRQIAIDEAIRRARIRYPERFQPEDEPCESQ